ncbi:MAG TPA: AAA family ATPase [Micromonospora sp.]|nr:AAA family ATPase [Micromonospora sp.]
MQTMLRGRDAERDRIARLIAEARAGRSGVLVVRGDAGIGKTALLNQAVLEAAGLRVLCATGVEAEAALPFAALQMLVRPVLSRLDVLPGAQAYALRGALGLSEAAGGDRLLVGLALLTLLSELAGEQPLLCLIDDAHWIDPESAEALLFAARRVDAEGVAVVFAARDGFDARGLPELALDRLDREAATALLAEHAPGLAAPLRDRILQESAGNPLALIELSAGVSDEEHVGQVTPAGALPVGRRVLAVFGAQIDRLPQRSRLALVVAAAEGTGDLGTVLQAVRNLGASAGDLEAAERAGLLRIIGSSVAFRHPLIRAAAYQNVALTTRLAVHEALAEVVDGDRRALHRATAAVVPDEHIAAELEHAAERARARGALSTAALMYEQAGRLSPDQVQRARRTIRAAQSAITAGLTEHADALTERATALTGDPLLHAGLAMVRASVEFERGTPQGTAQYLIDNAAPITLADPGLALTLLVIAAGNAWSSGEGAALRKVAALAATLERSFGAAGSDGDVESGFYTDRAEAEAIAAAIVALSHLVNGDHAAGLPILRALVAKARTDPFESLIARIFVITMALLLGDDETAAELAAADVSRVRRRGQAGALPGMLQMLAQAQVMAARHRDATATMTEAMELARDTGQSHRAGRIAAVTARIAAIEGAEERCRELVRAVQADSSSVAEAAAAADCALGLLDLGFGRYEEAMRRFEEAARGSVRHTAAVVFATADLVEAAVGAGAPERAAEPYRRFEEWAAASDRPWAAAVTLRCRAMLGPAEEAGGHYERAVRLHEEGERPFERARTELLYGAWLRRARRRSDAREPLKSALKIFERLGAVPWADRARAELRATGETVAPADGRGQDVLARLTPQELQIVRLAASGISNRDIAAQLFLSHRTVEYHLYKAYPKLGVTSRTELTRFDLNG